MTVLWPSYIPTPVQDGYRLRRGSESVSIRLDGGASRVRRDIVGASHEATCTFLVDRSEYTQLIGFLRERAQSRTALFRIPLLIDVPAAVNYLARVLDEPEELAAERGYAYTVQVRLEVLPNPIRSFTLILQSVSDDRIVDAGSSDYSGSLAEFPPGRDVMLVGCQGTVNSVALDLDGTYEIDEAPGAAIRTLVNAPSVNAGWTALRATAAQALQVGPLGGAAILLPE